MKRALITGASSGIGRALVERYRAEGWQVFGSARSLDRLADLPCTPLAFDITDRAAVHAAVPVIDCELDLLVLNAGVCEYIDDPVRFDDACFARVIEANLIGTGHCLAAFVPLLRRGGQLALMGSAATQLPFTRAEAYGASKAGIDYLAASLRVDLREHGIDVSLLRPGFVDTPLTRRNTFAMPGLIDADTAAVGIKAGLDRRRRTVAVPRLFNAVLGLLGALPAAVGERFATGIKNA